MKYNEPKTTSFFDKELKRLSKKYRSLTADIDFIKRNLEAELATSSDLGGGFCELRISIKSKGKDKTGGGRIITYERDIKIDERDIIFVFLYDKSEISNVNLDVMKNIINQGAQTSNTISEKLLKPHQRIITQRLN